MNSEVLKKIRRRHVLIWAGLLALFLFGFILGQHQMIMLSNKNVAIKSELREMRGEFLHLKNENSELALLVGVDKAALEEVRVELRDKRGELAGLKEEIAFYRGLMAPEDRQRGLSIREFSVEPADGERMYRFTLIVQQLSTEHKLLQGYVAVSLAGKQNVVDFDYPLFDLSDSIDGEKIPLSFKYFQVIEGVLTLPKGFRPEAIQIYAQSKGKRRQKVRKTEIWPWPIEVEGLQESEVEVSTEAESLEGVTGAEEVAE